MGKRFNLKNKYKMSTRPTVSVFSSTNAKEVVAEVRMPHVFLAPVRNDLVSFVHDQLSCNTRQAHGVNKKAGMKHQLNPGVQVELLPEFQELVDLVPIDQAKVPSVICVEREEWPTHFIPGEDGTERSTLTKEDMPWLQLSLPPPALHWLWPEVTESITFLNYH